MEESPTKDMEIDILAYKDKSDIVHSLPILKDYGFNDHGGSGEDGLNRNKVIIYIVLLYSHDSILNKRKKPLWERQYMAADYAGFKKKQNGSYPDEVVEKLFQLKDKKIQDMVHYFLQRQEGGSIIWEEIVTVEHEIEQMQKLRRDGNKGVTDANNLNKLLTGTQDRIKHHKDLLQEFYKDHENVKQKAHKRHLKDSLELRARYV